MIKTSHSANKTVFRLMSAGCLILLISLTFSVVLLADEPNGADACAECHTEETEAWHNSTHALTQDGTDHPGATCQNCHGEYIEGHPETGVMQLDIDSSVCRDCHADTFQSWDNSAHAQADVQCISCHLSHSQHLRLNDEMLCSSCHRDRGLNHDSHAANNVSCIDCHIGAASGHQIATSDGVVECENPSKAAHDFTEVSAKNCLSCHNKQDIHQEDFSPDATLISNLSATSTPDCAPKLAEKLKMAEESNKSLQGMTVMGLGSGLGIGGLLGIIFMLVVGSLFQRRKNDA